MAEKELITTDTILAYLENAVEQHISLSPSAWLDAAMKLTTLLGNEQDLLHKEQQGVAQKKLEILKKQDKRNVSAADLEVEASDEYKFMRDQESKIERIIEMARLAKVQARLRDGEFGIQ